MNSHLGKDGRNRARLPKDEDELQKMAAVSVACATLLVSAVLVFFWKSAAPAHTASPPDLQVLFEQYTAELVLRERSGATDRDLQSFYATWLDRFVAATAEVSAGDVPGAVRFAQIALANGIGDYVTAEQVASDGALNAADPTDRLSFLQQRLILQRYLASQSDNSAGIDVQRAADDACAAARDVAATPGFAVGGTEVLDVVSVFDAATQICAADSTRVMDLCAEVAELTRNVAPDAWSHIGWLWAPDQWYARAAETAIKAGSVSAAMTYLQNIESLPAVRISPADHALIVLGDPSKTDAFYPQLGRAWLQAAGQSRSATDVRIAYHLGFHLTQCSIQPEDTMEGIDLLESVLASPEPTLTDADADAYSELRGTLNGQQPARWQFEPVCSGAMTTVAITYLRIGLLDEAKSAASEALHDYPDHPSAQALQSILQMP